MTMESFVETQEYESLSGSDDDMEMDQQVIQEKTTVRRNFYWIKDKAFLMT